MDLRETYHLFNNILRVLGIQFQRVPGSQIILRYIKSSYQDDPIRSAVELFLFLFAVRYLLAPKYSTQKQNYVQLSEEEIDELVDEWQPEPLVSGLTETEHQELERRPLIVGPTGAKVKLSTGKVAMNLASNNVFGFVGNELLKERAVQTLRYYGLGACGPPGFYGTKDVDIKAEQDVAAFIGVPACIMYSQAFSTISSVIPAFSKRGDIIVADKSVNYAIRLGLQISRSTVRWYEHNDMEDLERQLAKVQKEQSKKRLTRRFIVTEGIFENGGDMTNLPKIVELKHKYKFRLILDESCSFMVLGRTGRGLTEHQNVDPNEVDMLIGSLAGTMCTGGGFCAGSEEVVEHQRITGAAYVFSAALPAIISTTVSEIVSLMQSNPEMLVTLREHIKIFRAQIDKSDYLVCTSAIENPVCYLTFKDGVASGKSFDEQNQILQEIVDEVLSNSILISRVKAVPESAAASIKAVQERNTHWKPALKVTVTIIHSKKEIERVGTVVRQVATKVLSKKK